MLINRVQYLLSAEQFVELTVERTFLTKGENTVKYHTVDGSAMSGEDYEASQGTLTFAPDSKVATIQVRKTLPTPLGPIKCMASILSLAPSYVDSDSGRQYIRARRDLLRRSKRS